MIEDLKRLLWRLSDTDAALERDVDRRVNQLIDEVRRIRPDTWEAEVAEAMSEVT